MTSSPSPQGALLHRLCPSCDVEVVEDRTTCATCGSKLVEIRDEVDTTVGTVIDDRFEIRSKLGQGGMGTVYRAWQKSVGREVAVKLIDRSYSRDAMAVRRFLREARLASQLSQPNTVSVFDFGQANDGRLFIAMELIRGRTLHEMVKTEGAFSLERVVRIGVQMCDALEAAHSLGIVHRDLKLENAIVLDDPPGRDLLKVLDFGLAKNIRDPGSRATESGIVVGTPRYMSPEAATHGVTGSAGDLYSVGVILGELATGKPMWTGETMPELITQKLDPRAVIARSPAAIRPLLEKLLAVAPERRPTAAQTRALLANVTSGEPSASDTLDDSGDGAGATTNLRSPSAPKPTDATRKLPYANTETPQPAAAVAGRVTVPSRPRPAGAASPSQLVAAAQQALQREPSTSGSDLDRPSSSVLDRPPVQRWPLVVVGLGALAAIAVTIVVASQSSRDDAPAAVRAGTPIDAAVAMPIDAEVATPDASTIIAPAQVNIRVTSEPSGASVVYREQTLTTPFSIVVDRGSEPFELVGRLRGRTAGTVKVVPDADKQAVIKLRARRTQGPSDEVMPF